MPKRCLEAPMGGYPQEELLKACDDAGEPELKEKLTLLLENNPHFNGFD